MLWTILYGAWLLGAGIWSSFLTESDFLVLDYNWCSLHDWSTVVMEKIPDIDDLGNIEFNTYNTTNVNGEGYSSWFMKRRVINLRGKIICSTKEELAQKKREIRSKLLIPNKKLRRKTEDGLNLYSYASCTGLRFPQEHYHITYCPIEAQFTIPDPLFYDTHIQEVSYNDQSESFVSSITNDEWSYKTAPTIFVYFGDSGVSGVTSVSVQLWTEILTIEDTFSNGDSIKIDCKNQDVFINGVGGQKYTWMFGSLEVWDTAFAVTIDWTWTVDIAVVWYPAY